MIHTRAVHTPAGRHPGRGGRDGPDARGPEAGPDVIPWRAARTSTNVADET